MTTIELREYLNHRIDELPPGLLKLVVEFVEFLLQHKPIFNNSSTLAPSSQLDSGTAAVGLSDQERLARLNQLFGAWANQPDLAETFAEQNSHENPNP